MNVDDDLLDQQAEQLKQIEKNLNMTVTAIGQAPVDKAPRKRKVVENQIST